MYSYKDILYLRNLISKARCESLWENCSDWLIFGRFSSSDVFEFDYDRIYQELEQQLTSVLLCPHLREDFIKAVLKRIPDKIKVGFGTEWDYREAFDPDPRAVKLTVFRDYYGEIVTETIMTAGISPCNSKFVVSIINEAAKECWIAAGRRL